MIYFSWATQIILAIISFLWLIPYYIAFKVGNRKYMSKTLDLSCNNRYTLMYYSGFFISILWYIMPFLNQPRFKLNIFSLFDIKGKHPIKYPFSLLYFHCTFAFAILHELLTYFHYDTRTI